MGLLDGFGDFLRTPEGQGLLSATFGGLAGARRGAPLNSLGTAGLAGLQGYSGALDRNAQMEQMAQMNELRKAQLSNYQSEADQRTAQAKAGVVRQQALASPFITSRATGGDVNVPKMGGVEMFSQGAAPAAPYTPGTKSIDVQKLLAAGVKPEEIAAIDGLKNLGKQKVARTMKGIGPDGREYEYQVDEFGGKVGEGAAQWKAPLMTDLGGNVSALDPYTLKPQAVMPKTMTFGDKTAQGQLGIAQQRLALDGQKFAFDRAGGVSGVADAGGTSQVAFNKQFGKAPAGFRWKADGSMEFIPGGPADQKAQMQKSGEGTVGGVVADLRDKYTQLDAENGIVSTKNRFGTNIGAWAGSTGLGQGINGAIGTKTQSARDSIAMTRPLLLQSIMKATGMSAKQMDSNAELKLYLATATDPQKGLEANLEALDRIESLYGGGNEKFKANTKQASTSNGWSMEKVR